VIEHAVASREDRLADLALEIDAVVEAAAARAAVVAAEAEGRGDARIGPRLGQRRAAKAMALIVEPAFRLVGRREPPEGLLALALAQAGEKDARRAVDGAALQDFDLGRAGR
jgi:hypothetical protein